MKRNSIILIGLMGGGKTTIGKALADRLQRPFLDTDACIVEREGRSINDIFVEEGEPYFRDLETDLLKELLAGEQDYVLAVGGGLPVREENRKLLRQLGTVIYLRAETFTLEGRLKGSTDRPLLKGNNLHDRIIELMGRRDDLYLDAADICLHTDGQSKEETLASCLEALTGNT